MGAVSEAQVAQEREGAEAGRRRSGSGSGSGRAGECWSSNWKRRESASILEHERRGASRSAGQERRCEGGSGSARAGAEAERRGRKRKRSTGGGSRSGAEASANGRAEWKPQRAG